MWQIVLIFAKNYFMKFNQGIPIADIASMIQAEIIGDNQLIATGINEIHKVEKGDIMFVDVERYYKKALASKASIIIINKRIPCPQEKALLFCATPFEAYNQLARRFRRSYQKYQPISAHSTIGEGTSLEHNVVIGDDVRIGKNCYIHANVVIYNNVIIGDNVIIHAGAVIGKDAFYYKNHGTHYEKWHAIGRVVIENDVEIGANCCVDKGVSGDTIIGEGTKIDNLVHIAHGVVIGKRCIIAAQVGIAGKSTIEDEVILYGQVGVSKSVTIGKKAVILAQSGISKSLKGGFQYFGSPADIARKRFRELAALRQLPDWIRKLRKK